VDATNNVWVASTGGSAFVISATNTGAARSTYTSGLGLLTPFIGADYSNNLWVADAANGQLVAVANSGTTAAYTEAGAVSSPTGVAAFGPLATGKGGNNDLSLWVLESSPNDAIQPFDVAAPLSGSTTPIGDGTYFLPTTLAGPTEIAADGDGNYYWTNTGNTNEMIPANVSVVNSSESQLSPLNNGSTTSGGYTGGSGYVGLDGPEGMLIDQSGNLWVVSQSNYDAYEQSQSNPIGPYAGQYNSNGAFAANVVEFVGLAAPTNPVPTLAAQAGKTNGYGAAGSYGVKP
jgi:hypothetical protein